MKMNFKKIVIFLLLFLVCFGYSFFVLRLHCDEIWNYGFGYNISRGLIPYGDFNMVVTPMYSYILSLFIIILGDHLYVMHIMNAIMMVIMLFLVYFMIGKKVLLIFPFILIYCYPGYNFFCLFLLIIIMYMSDKNFVYKDIVVGFLVGLLFLSKQTIGLCIFIPFIYYCRDKIKGIISFIIPLLIFCIYLLYYNVLYDFINYCFLGMFDFGSGNKILLFLPICICLCGIMLYELIKGKFQDKMLFYVLMFQIITIPICDDYHFMIGLIPVLVWILSKYNISIYKFKYIMIIVYFFCFYFNISLNGYSDYYIYSDRDSFMYGRTMDRYEYMYIIESNSYIDELYDKYSFSNLFIFSRNAYQLKLNRNEVLGMYDLINIGNMGYDGEDNYISKLDDICSYDKCLFVIYKYEFSSNSQTSREIIDYVYFNYNILEENDYYIVYSNLE